jgi:hypothetical protein
MSEENPIQIPTIQKAPDLPELLKTLSLTPRNPIDKEQMLQKMAWEMFCREPKMEISLVYGKVERFLRVQDQRMMALVERENEKIEAENKERLEEFNAKNDEDNNVPEMREEVADAAAGDREGE